MKNNKDSGMENTLRKQASKQACLRVALYRRNGWRRGPGE